ncbi:MAG: glycyl-radical enzyme activating protein [Ruminococcaceae bacterium]|nr:glycyl-radical enzyme activating protein [Oscillospiraceae bacterium]
MIGLTEIAPTGTTMEDKTTMKAKILEIKRFAVHDGKGIRTTVFFKGCPLHCLWCHNPESISFTPEIAYYEQKCLHCMECVSVCPTGAHQNSEGRHLYDRNAACTHCARCAKACLGQALIYYGKSMTVEELLPVLLSDKDFYNTTGGGVTLSGGECLMFPDFCAVLLQRLKEHGIHTAVDTCGFVPREALNAVIPYTDIFLYDVKAIREEVHIACTGQSNRLILENLRYLDSQKKNIEIRIPYVPGHNDTEMPAIAAFLATLTQVSGIRILPYHNFASTKYTALDIPCTMPKERPDILAIREAEHFFQGLPLIQR